MSKKPTKLSRARPKKDSNSKALNDSDEDFQSVIVKPTNTQKNSQKCQSIVKNDVIQNDTTAVETLITLPPCPFCQKKFSSNQELTRITHLKACATPLGVDTNQLLEIKKLEERQADEWKALNLPKVTNTSKNVTTKSSNVSLKVKRAQFQSSNDPNLEIALALSASMTATAVAPVENSSKIEKVEEVKTEPGNQCWLPQVRNIYN